MKITPILTLFLLSISSTFAQKYYLFVGTYTQKTSKGVYVYRFDAATGQLDSVGVGMGVKNPSFLAVAPNQRFVYSVGETDGNGSVNTFGFDKKTGKLTLLNSQLAGGANPCHVTLDQTGNWLLVGNYTGGNLSILPVQANGLVGKATQTINHTGSSVNTQRQEKPHVHSVNIAPNNKDVFVPDLGIDQIVSYQLDTQKGKLLAGNPPSVAVMAGTGPRHFTFGQNPHFAYVIQELSSEITAFRYEKGTLKAFQTVKTLPADFTGSNTCADIHVSPDGKFLYGSNRGHDSLAIFSIDPQTGALTLVGHQSVMGKTPRNFNFDPTGKYILVANQNTDNVVVFKRDTQTGLLNYTGKQLSVSMPVCLKWAKQ